MRFLKFAALGLFFLANTAIAGVVALPFYQEKGDAGDRFSPQNITGGPYFGIAGTIGDADTHDAFRFSFLGGFFGGASFMDEGVASLVASASFTKPLNANLYSNPSAAALTRTGSDGFYDWGVLSAGTYIIEFDTSLGDPPFLFSPSGAQLLAAPVPEPSTWALMLAGLAAVTFMRRRKTS